VILFEPERDHDALTFVELSPEDGDALDDGLFHDRATREWKSIELLDAANQRTSVHALAVTAVLLAHTGEKYKFEVITTGLGAPGDRQARLVRIEDRNGEAISIAYAYPAGATTADLGGDRTRLWQIQSVTDAYGLSAAFSYEPLQVGGMWAVNRIDLPNGGALEYEYRVANLANVGPFLERVVHPDGTLSSFTLSFDAGSQLVVIGYDDSAAGTSQVRKSVYVTTATFMSPSGAVSQAPNLVRKIVNGDGETVYQNFEDPADSRITYLYEGGSLLTKLQLNAAGYPESFWRATAPFAPGNDPRSFTFERLESYQANEDQMLTQRVDALGRIETLVRDPGTRAVKQVALDFDPPGSASIIDYNQFREPTHTEDRLDRVVDRTYDGAGNLRFVTAAPGTPEAATWESRYNSRGQLIASFDANGNRTDYAYHPSGRLASILEPADVSGGLRPTRSFTYDSAGRLATAVDPEGRTITYVHDLRNRLREVHHPDLSSETFTYGTGAVANLLVAQTDRNGNVTAYEYDLTKRLRATILAAGTAAEVRDALEYVPGTWLVSAEVRRGERKIYQRDGRNRVVAATTLLPGGQSLTTQTIWDGVAVDRVAKQIDAYGRATFAVYDDNDRISRTVRELVPGGVPSGADLLTLARDPAPNPPYVIEETVLDSMGQVRTRIDGRGVRTSFAYDERGRQISTTEAFGTAEAATTVTEHDPQGNVLRVLHPRTFTEGAVFATEYAYTGRNLRRLERVAAGTPDQAVTTTTFTLTGKPLTTTDARGNTTTYEYDACCDRLRRIIDPTGAATVNTYDPHGNVVSVVDPNGNTTTYAFDGLHRRTSETNGELETTVTTYDDDLSDGVGLDGAFPAYFAGLGFVPGRDGAAVMRTNALGERQVTIQDGLGRSLRRVDANGHAANTTYDQVMGGLVETARFDPLGHARRSRTDGAGRVRESIDAEGQVSRAFFDASGNRVSSRDANQVGEDCAFDPRGRSTYCQDTRGDARQSVFDAHGNLVTAFDGLLVPTTCDFDARDRRRSCTDRNGNTTTWSYDANSNLETQTDAEGGVTRYEYDSRNLRTEEHFPPDDGTDVKVMTYDPGRRLLTRTDQAGDTVTFHYDQANRLTRRQYPDLLDDLLAYDDASRLTSAISQRYTTTVTRAYDPDGRITHEDQTVFGVTRAVGFGYDAADRKTSITYPDATVVTRGYTDRNQLRTVNRGAALLATRAYDSGMRLATTALGNGLAETRTYRAGDNLLESLDVPGVHALGYTYDANKRKRLEQATTNPAESQTFDYDHEDRLTSWSRGGTASTQSWNLTPVGDWDDTTRDGVSEDRSHNRVHEITSIGATPVTHDPKGNLTQDHLGNVFAWDFDNRLKQAQRSGNPAVTYKYDALGRRLGKTVGGTNTTFVYDGDQVVAEYEGAGLARGYVYGSGIDEPLALVTAAGTYFYTQNHLDSVEALTDTAGVVVERYRYDAYGARQVLDAAGLPRAASLFGNPVGFTGRYHDDAVGLVDFRSRLYVPLTGRFASRDANYIDGPSLYVAYFVPNSTDPTGALVRNPLGRLLEALSSIGTAGLSYGEPAILGLGCPFDIDLQAAAPSPPPAPQPPRPNPQPTPTTRCEPSKETCCSERERGDANGYCPCDSRYKGSAPCTSGQGGIVAPGAGSPGSGSGGGAGGGSAGGGGGSSPPPDPFGGCEGRCSDLTPSNPPVSGWTACDDIKACHQDCCDEKWGGGANPNWYECNGIAEAKFKICKDTSPGKVWNRASLGAPSPTAFGVGIGAIAIGAALFLVPELIIPVAVLAF
jgi:RHS repeat-associated protein